MALCSFTRHNRAWHPRAPPQGTVLDTKSSSYAQTLRLKFDLARIVAHSVRPPAYPHKGFLIKSDLPPCSVVLNDILSSTPPAHPLSARDLH